MTTPMQPERVAGNLRNADAMSVVLLNNRELAAVLAALRLYEVAAQADKLGPVEVIATNCGELTALDAKEVSALCERINFGDDDGHAANVACISREFALMNEIGFNDKSIEEIARAAEALTLIEREEEGHLWELQQGATDWETVCGTIARRIVEGVESGGWDKFIRSLLR